MKRIFKDLLVVMGVIITPIAVYAIIPVFMPGISEDGLVRVAISQTAILVYLVLKDD